MKQAIKVLEKRIELLNKEYEKKDKQFEDCEMVCDYDFLQNDLANMELEIIEIQSAIKILNDNYLKIKVHNDLNPYSPTANWIKP